MHYSSYWDVYRYIIAVIEIDTDALQQLFEEIEQISECAVIGCEIGVNFYGMLKYCTSDFYLCFVLLHRANVMVRSAVVCRPSSFVSGSSVEPGNPQAD